ncbi:phosphoribosylamine--glycine ligase [candidate division KSB1 bacterium]|nr:phosphoribosylamine--glycine ligase [candidate division KSB1 bacterium]
MNVLVVGGGGREHALIWKIRQNPQVQNVFCAPGNAGIETLAKCVPEIAATDITKLVTFASKKKIDFTVVGPEAPLTAGLVDVFKAQGLKIFGPTQPAAELEGSKVYAKNFLKRQKIPTARWEVFDQKNAALNFIKKTGVPVVIKADGLAAGKGVIICTTFEAADLALQKILVDRELGAAGTKVIIEEYLQGEEISVLVVSDGMNYLLLPTSQDHKAIFDGDQGPNTGGMGAYSPVSWLEATVLAQIQARIVAPTITGMALEDRPYQGLLYVGLMLTADGPKVLEYNCRFGDPETQAVLPLLKTDLLEILMAAVDGKLASQSLELWARTAVCVIMASGGYPGKYQRGQPIIGLNRQFDEQVFIFHAGTKRDHDKILTDGGRVLGVTACATSLREAITSAYSAVGKITFNGAYYRKDIGQKALNH